LYGVPRAGAALVHGNTRHTATELVAMLERCDARVVMGSSAQLERLSGVLPDSVSTVVCLDAPCGSGAGWVGVDDLAGLASPQDETARSAVTDAEVGVEDSDMAWLLYTSGTTGRAKGAMLTHRSLIAAALNTTMSRPVADDEVYLFPFPLFHVAAYNVVHHHLRQRPVVLLPSFEPVAAMAAIETESVTSVSLAPTMLAMLLDCPDRADHDISTLRTVSYGAAAMPLDVMRRSLAELPDVGLAQGYGMTELSGNAAFLSPEDHRRAATTDPDLLTAAGRPAPMTSLRIVSEDGSEAGTGEVGEIHVHGDQVCAGYFDEPEVTAAAIVDGWLQTGDVGRIDERGYLHVVDRVKDIIITGGENVSSREVEDALGSHPAVRSIAVVGRADDRWGELVVAVVVLHPGSPTPAIEELRAHCEHLAGFKHPRDVRVVEDLPTNASGKVDKVALRALVAD
ncbi:MAG: AMP-binding protein, partial [Microthrixaceae bacterium]